MFIKRTLSLMLALLCLLPLVPHAHAQEAPAAAPIPGSSAVNPAPTFWETPMDITDTQAIWAMLTAPITVVKGHQKQQTVLREAPDDKSAAVADITFDSQGVHILQTLDNGWSLVEIYSSSFHDSKIKAWNQLTQGYIRTDRLQEKQPNQVYGMVVDKLTQKLYIFKEGALYDTLAVSTGLSNDRQPYNETRSGDFIIVSPVGDFVSDNVVGEYALRFNDGDFLHQVPYIARGSNKVYDPLEAVLGERASHGCVRVQRKRTPLGTNMRWIWDNMRRLKNVRLVIWEDVQGRQMSVPAGSTPLYYNSNGGRDYHAAPTCYGVRDKFYPLHEFRYDEIENAPYSALNICQYCYPPMREGDIQALNSLYRAN